MKPTVENAVDAMLTVMYGAAQKQVLALSASNQFTVQDQMTIAVGAATVVLARYLAATAEALEMTEGERQHMLQAVADDVASNFALVATHIRDREATH